MSEQDPFPLPPQWQMDSIRQDSAQFSNEDQALEVTIRAVYGSKRKKHFAKPIHYVINLQQDWFSRDSLDEKRMSAKVDTWEDALDVAEEFMNEFCQELAELPAEEVEAVHRATGSDHESAEQTITTEIAAEAFADAAGYSDDLLLSVLAAETNDQYRLVIHREGADVTTVAGDTDSSGTETSLQTLHAVFPLDRTGIKAVLAEELPVIVVFHLGDATIYRFIFDDAQETNIVLPRGTQVTSPGFETTIANVLEEKWID